jgi:hypothetical protein
MNPSIKIDISGNLKRALQNMNEQVMTKVKKMIIESCLVDIESVAKNRLTTKQHVVTGRLRASIHTRYANYNNTHGYRNLLGESFNDRLKIKPIEKPTYFEAYVGTSVNYAGKIERLDAYLYPSFLTASRDLKKNVKRYLNNL